MEKGAACVLGVLALAIVGTLWLWPQPEAIVCTKNSAACRLVIYVGAEVYRAEERPMTFEDCDLRAKAYLALFYSSGMTAVCLEDWRYWR